MNLFLNLIWFIFGGWGIFCEYIVASFWLFISIIGIPFGVQAAKLSLLASFPFGCEVREDPSAGAVPMLLNIIWIVLGGIWISITHWLMGIVFFITIIGIPFGKQHFKLAKLALAPFGKVVVREKF